MADKNRVIVQCRKLLLECRLPCGVSRITFVRHPWVTDLEVGPKLAPQALDELVVPVVVRAGAPALDEQQLASHQRLRTGQDGFKEPDIRYRFYLASI